MSRFCSPLSFSHFSMFPFGFFMLFLVFPLIFLFFTCFYNMFPLLFLFVFTFIASCVFMCFLRDTSATPLGPRRRRRTPHLRQFTRTASRVGPATRKTEHDLPSVISQSPSLRWINMVARVSSHFSQHITIRREPCGLFSC